MEERSYAAVLADRFARDLVLCEQRRRLREATVISLDVKREKEGREKAALMELASIQERQRSHRSKWFYVKLCKTECLAEFERKQTRLTTFLQGGA